MQLLDAVDDGASDGRVGVRARWFLAVMRSDLDLLETVGVQVLAEPREDIVRVLVGDEPEVELGRCLGGQHRLRTRALVAGGDAGYVACRCEQKLLSDVLGHGVADEALDSHRQPSARSLSACLWAIFSKVLEPISSSPSTRNRSVTGISPSPFNVSSAWILAITSALSSATPRAMIRPSFSAVLNGSESHS